jgi:hypothetical protein
MQGCDSEFLLRILQKKNVRWLSAGDYETFETADDGFEALCVILMLKIAETKTASFT